MSARLCFGVMMYCALVMMSFGVAVMDAWVEYIYMESFDVVPMCNTLAAVCGSLLLSTGLTLLMFCAELYAVLTLKPVFNGMKNLSHGGERGTVLLSLACQ